MERFPGQTFALTAPIEPLEGRSACLIVQLFHSPRVPNEPIVIPCTPELGSQGAHQFGQRQVTILPYPVRHPLMTAPQLLAGCAPFDSGSAFSIRFPVKLKSQKVEPPVVLAPVVPEAQRLGFIRCHFQSKLGQPYL